MSLVKCSECGSEVSDQATTCPSCGCPLNTQHGTTYSQTPVPASDDYDRNHTGLNILSFLIPLVGLILYIVYHSNQPIKAKGIGKWALIGFIVGVILSVFII